MEEMLGSELGGSVAEDPPLREDAEALAVRLRRADPSGPGATGRRPVVRSGEPAFPVGEWDRYANIRFLGRGAMGMVFLALDRRLRRPVAIKFVHGDDPGHTRRLILEARAQAQVSHDRVCKVHEVGEVAGRVYIAMEYVAGASLGEMAGRLTVEEKVRLVRGAAEGIHEAHRAGIIHRDIKPSNILVAEGEGGELSPYVMDFGLARAAQEDGGTRSGSVVGTPRYMAPEQARGDGSQLDRRADVYALGATLYHLVTGRPSVAGATLDEVVYNLLTEEPRSPRSIDPAIPADLEAILVKCLEKDRSARYDSARALADDLGRFLDGDPVAARPAGVWYRWRKRVAKHRRLTAAGAAVALLLAAALGWGVATRRAAAGREVLVRRFTEKVEHIEAMARYSALSPAHDIRGDRAAIRGKMAELEREIRGAGPGAEGPGRYALGRGYLALDDFARARAELEAAWRLGFREPRAAYALARALGALYQRNQIASRRIESRALRAARQEELERLYRDPALAYLAASRGADAPSPEYAAALAAFYQGRLDEALGHLDVIGGELPWFYEARQLRGDILLARSVSLGDRGDPAAARADFDAGRRAYAAAAAVAESAPSVHESLGELEYAAMLMELYGAGDVAPAFERAITAVNRALAVQPDRTSALVLRAQARRSMAEYEVDRGRPADDELAQAVADAERAVAIAPSAPEARVELARTFRQWGQARQARNQDPAVEMRRAVAVSESIPAADRDVLYHGNLGLVFTVWANYQDQVGADSRENRGKAIDAYGRALQLRDQAVDVWINLAVNHIRRASHPRAVDPDGDLGAALAALERATSIAPGHVAAHFYRGEAFKLAAERARVRGRDPGPDLVRARAAYERGLAVNHGVPQLWNGVGWILSVQAGEAWDRGEAPEPLLDQARAAFERAIAAAPEQAFAYDNVGSVLAQGAWFRRARGEDPDRLVGAAVGFFERAIERVPDQAAFWADLGAAHSIAASSQLERGRDPRLALDRAQAALRTALEKNGADARARLHLGETLGLRARLHARQGRGREDEFAAAAEAYDQAVALAPGDHDARIAFGHFCRWWAAFERANDARAAAALDRGLALAGEVLAARPAWPEARVLRASLLLAQARGVGSLAGRRDLAARAADDFGAALAANRSLEPVWRRQAAAAQRLAAGPR